MIRENRMIWGSKDQKSISSVSGVVMEKKNSMHLTTMCNELTFENNTPFGSLYVYIYVYI